MGRDPEENDQQPEYDDFVTREQKGKGIYIPYDKNETNRTGKLVPLLINLRNYLDPSKFGKDFEDYTREQLHCHLHQAKKLNAHGLVNLKMDVLDQNIMLRTVAEGVICFHHLYKLLPVIFYLMEPSRASSEKEFKR